MTSSKEVEQLLQDLDLVSQTAKVLATKIEKISSSMKQILASMEGPSIPTTEGTSPSTTPEPTPTPTPVAPVKPEPRPIASPTSSEKMTFDTKVSSKAARLLDGFLSQTYNMTNGQEIAEALSLLRDKVMQSAGIGFHPAFHEMGRYASQLKSIREITTEEKENLVEKVHDWKTRLTS
ncbi:MAG: hypothetical protein ACFFE8_16180 [Candidatus Heimdallarchaeota archaeon]